MVESYKLLCVVAIVETFGNSSGHIGVIVVGYTVIGCPTVIGDADMPEAMAWLAPPSEDTLHLVAWKNTSHLALHRMAMDSKLLMCPGRL